MNRTYTYSELDRKGIIKNDLKDFCTTAFWILVGMAGISLLFEGDLIWFLYSLPGLLICATPGLIGYFRMIRTSVVEVIVADDGLTVTYFNYLRSTLKVVIPLDQLSFSVRVTFLRGTTTDVIIYSNHKKLITIVPYNAEQEALNAGLIWDLLELKNNKMERRLRYFPLSKTYARSVCLADTNLERRLRKISDEMKSESEESTLT